MLSPQVIALDPHATALIESVVTLYQKHAELVFPDVDNDRLDVMSTEVEAAIREVEEAEAVMDEARQRLSERRKALLAAAKQGLAYARVYAENHPPLKEVVDAIRIPEPALTSSKKPRRKARKKTETQTPELAGLALVPSEAPTPRETA